jgi:uncharacterized protein involved in outer membrane biogenesis
MLSRNSRNALYLLASVAVLAGLYTIAGFYGVPRLLRSSVQQFASEHYHRNVAIGEIRFNPYTFALQVRDFSCPDADGKTLLSFGRLLVNLDFASLWRRGASFEVIELERPFARVLIRKDGALNLADLALPSQPEKDKAEAKPTRLFIDQLRVSAGQATFEDRTHAAPFRAQLRPVSFELRDFSTTEHTGNTYALRGQSVAGERFEWRGTFNLDPVRSRGHFQVTALQARTLWNYLRDALGFEISSGLIGLTGDYELASAARTFELKSTVHKVSVFDLGIRPRGTSADYVHLSQIQVDDTRFDLVRTRVDIGKVRLLGGDVRAWSDAEGKLNLLELTKPAADGGDDSKPSPWIVAAPNITVEGWKVALEDRQFEPAAAFKLQPIDLQITDYTSKPGTRLGVTARMGINGSGSMQAKASVVPDSGAVSAHVQLAAFDLTALQPYIGKFTQMSLLSGKVATELDAERAPDGALQIKGDTEVTQLRTVDNALRKDFIKWDSLKASGIEYQSTPARLRVGTITTREPYARVIIAPDQSVNISRVLSNTAGATAQSKGKTESTSVSIGTVRITNGSANFADFWIQPNYAVSIQGLNGSITGLSSEPRSRAKLQLDGKVDRYAPAHIGGEVNLLSASLFSDIKMSFKGVELTSVTPYSGRFAGYKIEKGKLSVDLAYHVENRKLDAEQRFVIDQLQLGEPVESPDAVKLPLRLAVALLKDRNGVIDIGLPVSGSLDDPKFRLGPIIWKAVVGLLTKAATAPFALLGKLFGGGEEMNEVYFAPGETTLDAAGQEKLGGLIKALKERPSLELEVPMPFSPELDRPVLLARQLDTKLLARARDDKSLLSDPAKRFELLVAQYREELGKDTALPPAALAIESRRRKKGADFPAANREMEAVLNEKQPLAEDDLEALGKLRSQAVQDVLLASGEIEPSRIFVIGAKPQSGATDKVRLEMSLK